MDLQAQQDIIKETKMIKDCEYKHFIYNKNLLVCGKMMK